jgi:molybdopterin-guanine dinucleotide biosynthesis protein A
VKVSVVVNESQNNSLNLPRVVDVFPERGALGGIHAALSQSQSEWTIILACDYPFVTNELLKRLAGICLYETEASAIAPIQSDGRVQPLCAFYQVAPCLKAVNKLLAESGKTPPARRLLDSVKTRTVDFAKISDLPCAEFFFENVNTPADFVRAEEIYQNFLSKRKFKA